MVSSLWLWRSMKPGAMTRPVQSIVLAADLASTSPTATILPSWMRTLPRCGSAPVPSMIVPLERRMSVGAGSARRAVAARRRTSVALMRAAMRAAARGFDDFGTGFAWRLPP
jgi:hypothetical protein